MGAIAVEDLMAALYTNHALRRAFLSEPHTILDRYDLTEEERGSLLSTDKPGLVLAGNSFAYKRWKANQWRFVKVYPFTSYDDVFGDADLGPVRELFSRRFDTGNFSSKKTLVKRKVVYTHSGISSAVLSTAPGNQHNHEHVLMESPALAPVARIWKRLFDLTLRDHFLIRLYFFRATVEGLGISERLHPRPGAYITYVPLGSLEEKEPAGFITALMSDAQAVVAKEPLRPGRAITYPADALQRIDAASGNESLSRPIDLLCVKSLCAAV